MGRSPRKTPRATTPPTLQTAFLVGDVSPKACGWRIQLLRMSRGEIRDEFAPRIGMESKNLHSVESGRSYIRPRYAKQIYEQFGVDFDFIYYGEPRRLTVEMAQALLDAISDLPPPEPPDFN